MLSKQESSAVRVLKSTPMTRKPKSPANSRGPGALEQASSRFAKIREYLRAKGVEGLVEMVVGLAERDPSLLKQLELSAVATAADDATLLAQFKKAVTEATRTHGYVEYS